MSSPASRQSALDMHSLTRRENRHWGMSMEDMIVIKGLVKRFGDKTAVNGLDLVIHRGELFGFLGPNGAGKTTTLRCVSTLTGFDEGTITVNGHDITKEPEAAKGSMGVIQQQVAR